MVVTFSRCSAKSCSACTLSFEPKRMSSKTLKASVAPAKTHSAKKETLRARTQCQCKMITDCDNMKNADSKVHNVHKMKTKNKMAIMEIIPFVPSQTDDHCNAYGTLTFWPDSSA